MKRLLTAGLMALALGLPSAQAATPGSPPDEWRTKPACSAYVDGAGFRLLSGNAWLRKCRPLCDELAARESAEMACYSGWQRFFERDAVASTSLPASTGAPVLPPSNLRTKPICSAYVGGSGFQVLSDNAWLRKCRPLCDGLVASVSSAEVACYSGRDRFFLRAATGPTTPTQPTGPSTPSNGQDTGANDGSRTFEPPGYGVVWREEFDRLRLADWRDSARDGWYDFFVAWGRRQIQGNGDQGVKLKDTTVLPSGRTAGEVLREAGFGPGPYLHETSGGTLKLRSYPVPANLRDEFWTARYVAGMISAEDWFAHENAYWEIRARVNRIGKGHHLAMWLIPEGPSWPPEFDIFETIGNAPNDFYAFAHPEKPGYPITKYAAPNGYKGWHTFGLLRTPTQLRWTVDGKTVRTQPNYGQGKKFFPIISWEIAGQWTGDADASTPWPAEVEVDYIRVYQK